MRQRSRAGHLAQKMLGGFRVDTVWQCKPHSIAGVLESRGNYSIICEGDERPRNLMNS
jgi:hypothetical protein